MKKILKYVALFGILATATNAFIAAFTPEYEAWKEKYPSDPEESDEETPADVVGEVVKAQDLFPTKDKED